MYFYETVTLSDFSPLDQTRIVRHGDRFRIRDGRLFFTKTNKLHRGQGLEIITYLCELEFDHELEVWHLVGDIETISHEEIKKP